MKITKLAPFSDVFVLEPERFIDHRGHFSEFFSAARFEKAGLQTRFVQDNISHSEKKGTVRGLHYQTAPMAQVKLVRVLRGKVWDVVVDVRAGSPTYGQYATLELDAQSGRQLYIPAGFAHGLCTLDDHTDVLYKVSELYSPQHDTGIVWNDPELGIPWPVDAAQVILSDRDRALPRLSRI